MRLICALSLLSLAHPNPAPAHEQPSYSGSMGSVTVGQEQCYRLSFRPDIPIGRWGVARDVELFVDFLLDRFGEAVYFDQQHSSRA